MDPVSQGALGAIAVQSTVGHRIGKHAWAIGAISGMAPDLDVLIRSSTDPLVALEMHRHFTHSLAFVPIGGAIAALPFLASKSFRENWRWVLVAGIIGFFTHAPLDCGTSYGTSWFWPFSDERVTWDFIPIIDPLYTVPLCIFVFHAARTWGRDVTQRSWIVGRRFALLGMLLTTFYLGLCGVQRIRAGYALDALAAERGHSGTVRNIIPLPLSNRLWTSVYREGDRAWVDGFIVPWFGQSFVVEGEELAVATELPEGWKDHPNARRLFEVWGWFSQGWVHQEPSSGGLNFCDLRHSAAYGEYRPIFCSRVDEEGIMILSDVGEATELLDALWGDVPGQRPLD